jgi:hypothetical protein
MLKIRVFAAGIGVLAAATFALAGCGTKAPEDASPPPTSSAPQVPAKAALASAFKKLEQQSFKAEQTMDGLVSMKGTSAMDPAAKKADVTIETGVGDTKIKVVMRSLNNEIWVKMSGVPGLADKWMHVPADKVKKGSSLDPYKFDTSQLSNALVSAERDGASGFKGTMDVTVSGSLGEDAVKQLGDKAKAVPFTATVDGQGRVSQFTLDMNSVVPGMGSMKTIYSGYGDPVTVSPPPASEVIEMPAQLIESFNKA